MPLFTYRAYRADGGRLTGQIESPSASAAAATLSRRGLIPVRLNRLSPTDLWGWRRPSRRDLATVLQSMASLVDAGVPLQQALEATADLAPASLRNALIRIENRVRDGFSLARSMEGESGLFSQVTIGLLRAGESGVGTGPALDQAALQLEREAESAARIRAALTYPILLSVVGTLSIALITFFVVPRFATLVADSEQALPVATATLLAASGILRSHGIVLGLVAAFLLIGCGWLASHYPATLHRWLLGVPSIGTIRHGFATARAARILGALLGAGVSAVTALETAARSVGDHTLHGRLLQAAERVRDGSGIAPALESVRALTSTATRMAGIGEASGRLSTLLLKAATLEEQAADGRLKSLVGIIEPLLILTFAAVVAFVAAALLQAIYSVRPAGL